MNLDRTWIYGDWGKGNLQDRTILSLEGLIMPDELVCYPIYRPYGTQAIV